MFLVYVLVNTLMLRYALYGLESLMKFIISVNKFKELPLLIKYQSGYSNPKNQQLFYYSSLLQIFCIED